MVFLSYTVLGGRGVRGGRDDTRRQVEGISAPELQEPCSSQFYLLPLRGDVGEQVSGHHYFLA